MPHHTYFKELVRLVCLLNCPTNRINGLINDVYFFTILLRDILGSHRLQHHDLIRNRQRLLDGLTQICVVEISARQHDDNRAVGIGITAFFDRRQTFNRMQRDHQIYLLVSIVTCVVKRRSDFDRVTQFRKSLLPALSSDQIAIVEAVNSRIDDKNSHQILSVCADGGQSKAQRKKRLSKFTKERRIEKQDVC